MSETRILYVWLLYNWKTREKRFFENESHGPNSVGEFYGSWTPADGEKLYMLHGEIALEVEHEIGSVLLSLIREDHKTRDPLPPGRSVLEYIGRRAMGRIQECLPPEVLKSGIGPIRSTLPEMSEGKVTYVLATSEHKFRITVEKI